jgi:hypothetical protein
MARSREKASTIISIITFAAYFARRLELLWNFNIQFRSSALRCLDNKGKALVETAHSKKILMPSAARRLIGSERSGFPARDSHHLHRLQGRRKEENVNRGRVGCGSAFKKNLDAISGPKTY